MFRKQTLAVFTAAILFMGVCSGDIISNANNEQTDYVDALAEMISENQEQSKEIIVDTTTHEITLNGESTTLKESIGVSSFTEWTTHLSDEALQNAMENKGYSLQECNNGVQIYTSDFSTCRLIVKDPQKKYNATSIAIRDDGYAILQFDNPEDTAKAYHQYIKKQYDVIIDEPVEVCLSKVDSSDDFCSYGTGMMNLDVMQNESSSQSKDLTIAVVDSGVDINICPRRFVDGINTIYTDQKNVNDVFNHGSLVSSVILDNTPDNIKIMPVKAVGDDEKATVSSIELGLQYAINNGADVINMSLGANATNATTYSFWNHSIDTAIEKGIPVIAAAGNKNQSTDTVYPACYVPCWTVSAITSAKQKASFSNYGNIDFCAPGNNITAYDKNGEKTSGHNGTSFATPYISAMAAMLKCKYPDYTEHSLHEKMIKICKDLGAEGYDEIYGYGLPMWTGDVCEQHDWKAIAQVKNTCISTGTIVYQCSVCGQTKTELVPIDPDQHSTVSEETKAPSCEMNGYIRLRCNDCKKILEEKTLDATGHTWKHEIVEPDNTSDGYERDVCERCGLTQNESILPATSQCEHQYELVEQQDSTCTAPGVATYKCSKCDGTYEELLPVIDHVLIEQIKEATQTSDGYDQWICSNCGYVAKRTQLPKLETAQTLETATIVRVIDGDTIVVSIDGEEKTVRMIGIDTPESVNPDASLNTSEGEEASKFLTSILKENMTVYLERDESSTDVYGRELAYVWLINTFDSSKYVDFCKYNVGAIIMQNTYCKSVAYEPNTKYKDWYDKLETENQKQDTTESNAPIENEPETTESNHMQDVTTETQGDPVIENIPVSGNPNTTIQKTNQQQQYSSTTELQSTVQTTTVIESASEVTTEASTQVETDSTEAESTTSTGQDQNNSTASDNTTQEIAVTDSVQTGDSNIMIMLFLIFVGGLLVTAGIGIKKQS